MTVGFEVLVQEVIAAIDDRADLRTVSPRGRRPGWAATPTEPPGRPPRKLARRRRRGRRGPAAGAGPARLGSTVAEVELEEGVEVGPGARLAPQPLLLRVALDEVDERSAARPVRRR